MSHSNNMFEQKQRHLFTEQGSKNKFIQKAEKISAETLSENGALKYSTTGNEFVDQFGSVGTYKTPRPYQLIADDCEKLWSIDPESCVRFIFYIRTITRVTSYMDGTKTKESQKGAGMIHEGIMRMIWLHTKSEQIFWDNISLFICVGSWKDIIQMLSYDLQYNKWERKVLNWTKFKDLLLSGLNNQNQVMLVKKYLPSIKSKNNCKTIEAQADNIIAKWVCNFLYGEKNPNNYKKYRLLKSSGTAHEWQKLISQSKFDEIDFDKIAGRALNKLVTSKFLSNQGLKSKYEDWINSKESQSVKYTGFVYELFKNLSRKTPEHIKKTIDAQFLELVQKAGELKTDFIVVRDTSWSMEGEVSKGISADTVAKSLALFFSYFLKGQFANSWIEFNSCAQMHKWVGKTPSEKYINDKSCVVGSTNFQNVIELFIRLKNEGVPESDFPKGILCISDGEFNEAGNSTNFQRAFERLSMFFSKEYVDNFSIVLWDVVRTNKTVKFETYGTHKNCFHISGFDGSVMSFFGDMKVVDTETLIETALNQELFCKIKM